jgi:DNA polymerase III delta subunit
LNVAAENALSFLRALNHERLPAPLVVIAGAQAFLREYTLERLRIRLGHEQFKGRSFHVGGADRPRDVISELDGGDLFAPRRLVVCRLLRAWRERAGSDDDDGEGGGSDAGGEAALAAAAIRLNPSLRFTIVCERDNAPAKIRRAAETHGVLVNCGRPFDNQLAAYADLFARNADLKLSPSASDLLITRYGSDLSAIANALGCAAITAGPGRMIEAAHFAEPAATRIPYLFELADAIARGRASEALALFNRALETGRDPFELLAVELIPLLRRMMVAGSLLADHKGPGMIASALGLAPNSTMVMRAIEGARSFGLERLQNAYRRACELDEQFKAGLLKEREMSIAALLIDLMTPNRADGAESG